MKLSDTIKELNFSNEDIQLFVESVIKVTEDQDKNHLVEFFKRFENIEESVINSICEKALKNEFGLIQEEIKKCPVCGKEFECKNNEKYCSEKCAKKDDDEDEEDDYDEKTKESEDFNIEEKLEEKKMSISKLVAEGYLKGLEDFENDKIQEAVNLKENGDDFIKGYEMAISEKKEEEKKIAENLNLYDIVKEIRKLKESVVDNSKEEENVKEYETGYAYGLVDCESGLKEMSVKDDDKSKYAIGYRDAWNLFISERKELEEKVDGLDKLDKNVSSLLQTFGKILKISGTSFNYEVETKLEREGVLEKEDLQKIIKNKALGAIWPTGKGRLTFEVDKSAMKEDVEESEDKEVELNGKDLFVENVSEDLKKEILENFEKSINKEIEEKEFLDFMKNLEEKIDLQDDEKEAVISHIVSEYNKISEEIKEDTDIEEEKEEIKKDTDIEEEKIDVTEIVEKHTEKLFESDKEKVSALIEKIEFESKEDFEKQLITIVEEFINNKDEDLEEEKELSEEEKFLIDNNLLGL